MIIHTNNKNKTFLENREKLGILLESSFRKGINCGVRGLHRCAPSDHLPLDIYHFDVETGISYAMLSWNLLADVHLGNNYRNIDAYRLISRSEHISNDNTFKKRPHWLLSYLGEYVHQQANNNKVTIDDKLLKEFPAKYNFSKERDKDKARICAEKIVNHFLDYDQLNRETFLYSVKHAAELYHSTTEQGYLNWKNRFKLLTQDKTFLSRISGRDFYCFQECTNPEDMLSLVSHYGGHYKMITHKISSSTNDHCVIIYDASKYELKHTNKFGLGLRTNRKTKLKEPTKPAILAAFQARNAKGTDGALIIGSIHHPGGEHNEFNQIKTQLNVLSDDMKIVDCSKSKAFILGDYNHMDNYFEQAIQSSDDFTMMTAPQGTMAGPDYGSTNKGIDGVITNQAHVILRVSPMKLSEKVIDLGIDVGVAEHVSRESVSSDLNSNENSNDSTDESSNENNNDSFEISYEKDETEKLASSPSFKKVT